MRIGHGYDVHKLIEGRKLVLGGVEIPYEKGLLGHSDADVLTHALMDAMLGAAALGDIGRHFPDSSGEFKDISSLVLLQRCVKLLDNAGYRIVNADITVIAQAPKLAKYIPDMLSCLAQIIGCKPGDLNIKATTEEGLGFTGNGDGIACHAVCLIESK
ncbi:MAG: 2-C-methyl-D-erythritol 2,4-cyclodiphosphate synthase [Ruminococcaceae bacterium]|nr:2-C-methyl-D-erythritol 2,4-cyclodiphosphate synthase [Oscillospiraceae bacterium]